MPPALRLDAQITLILRICIAHEHMQRRCRQVDIKTQLFGNNNVQNWHRNAIAPTSAELGDRKSVVEGKSVSVRVDLGGRRIIKKKKTQNRVLQVALRN